jgi:hypothetical protein
MRSDKSQPCTVDGFLLFSALCRRNRDISCFKIMLNVCPELCYVKKNPEVEISTNALHLKENGQVKWRRIAKN